MTLPRRSSLLPVLSVLIGLGPLVVSHTAVAHHSFAMFDAQKSVTLIGTVREFQYTNPHCWIQLLVPNTAGGGTAEWSIEMAAPSHLVNAGWTKNTVKPGDKITLIIRPLRDGTHGGSFVSAIDQAGRKL